MARHDGFKKLNILGLTALFGIMCLISGCTTKSNVPPGVWHSRSVSPEATYHNGADLGRPGMTRFQNAGPVQPPVDMTQLLQSRRQNGPYRIGPGDVIEFRMPAVLRVITPDLVDSLGQVEPYATRVSSRGTVLLPIVGEISVTGKTMAEVEAFLLQAYYPKYVVNPPSIVGQVAEYHTAALTVLGAVNKPGVYHCHRNEMTLVNLIMKAEGIVDEGATVIRIRRADDPDQAKPMVLPIKGLAIPFADVELHEGDTVEIERLAPQVFTVIGLVNRSGTFPYPPQVSYNLLQALAFAGGVNDIAAPEFARVYRQDPEGRIITASFRLKGSTPADAAAMTIKPGDVVAVEHTFSTQARLFLAQVLSIKTGVNAFATYRIDTDFDDAVNR